MPQRPQLGSIAGQADAITEAPIEVASGRAALRPRLESAAQGQDMMDASPRMPSARSSSRPPSSPEQTSAVLGRVILNVDELDGQDDII